MSQTPTETTARPWTLLGMPLNRKIRTGEKHIAWSAAFILSLIWFTWAFHIFAGGLALTFTINRYTNDPRIIAFVQNINVIIMLGPFISYISDQIWSRLGRRRPFMIIAWAASCFAMFSFAFLPQVAGVMNAGLRVFGIPPVSEFILLIGIITGYTTLYDLQAPIEPLFLECVPPHQRGRFFAIRGVLFKLAVLLFFQVFWASYADKMDMFNWIGFGGRLYLTGEQCIYILGGCLFFITGGYMLFNIEEVKDPKAPNRKFTELFTGSKTAAPVRPDPAMELSAAKGSQLFLWLATASLIGYTFSIMWEIAYGPGKFWKVIHLILLAPATHAIMAFLGKKPSAPSSTIALLGARTLLSVLALAVAMLFAPEQPRAHIVWNLVGSIGLAAAGIPYLLLSRQVKYIFKTNVLGALYRIPIVAFFVGYVKDVFLTWSNYPFYIVLVIPGIEQTVWGNFSNLMQTRQFNYSMSNQALWGLPSVLLGMIILTPFSGWYSDSMKRIPFWLRQLALIFGGMALSSAWMLYGLFGPSDIRELPDIFMLFAIAALTSVGCLAVVVWMTETLLSFVGREHTRAWATLLATILGLIVNIAFFATMQLAPDKTIPITLFMMLQVAGGSFNSLLETFVGPMIYEYMPRSKMGTINSGRGLMGDGLRWLINNLGGWWIWWYSLRTMYPGQKNVDPETMKYDYTSMYILMFILYIPVIAAQVWFIIQIVKKNILRWGVLEVEGEDGELPVEQETVRVTSIVDLD
jgi:MFS family permease